MKAALEFLLQDCEYWKFSHLAAELTLSETEYPHVGVKRQRDNKVVVSAPRPLICWGVLISNTLLCLRQFRVQ